ncbi:hypothetical protein CR513_57181, partial [Mucuna pruriens]
MVMAHQGHNVWEMNVTLHVTMWLDEDDDDDDDYIDLREHQYVLQPTSQIVDLLKEVETTKLPFYFADHCAICLEEFYSFPPNVCMFSIKSALFSGSRNAHFVHARCVVSTMCNGLRLDTSNRSWTSNHYEDQYRCYQVSLGDLRAV